MRHVHRIKCGDATWRWAKSEENVAFQYCFRDLKDPWVAFEHSGRHRCTFSSSTVHANLQRWPMHRKICFNVHIFFSATVCVGTHLSWTFQALTSFGGCHPNTCTMCARAWWSFWRRWPSCHPANIRRSATLMTWWIRQNLMRRLSGPRCPVSFRELLEPSVRAAGSLRNLEIFCCFSSLSLTGIYCHNSSSMVSNYNMVFFFF